MKSILLLLSFSLLINIQTIAQRESERNGRGQESGNIQRINRNQENNRRDINNQRTISRDQTITQQPVIIQQTEIIYIETRPKDICIVKNPDEYNFPDRIYEIPYIEPVLQFFFVRDFDGAIELLNYLIDANPFVPEFHFLRGVAYIKRESDFKNSDYWEAERDFSTVKILDPAFPGLKHYLDLLDFYLWGKRPSYIGKR